jgi:precorrin-6A/cobalt-precorrin-6A reductase
MNLLILGGTTEATALGRALAGDPRFSATLSLAGVTRRPA